MITQEAFEEWRESPVTVAYLKTLQQWAEETTEQYQAEAWSGNYLTPKDQVWLGHLRGRSNAYTEAFEMSFEELREEE